MYALFIPLGMLVLVYMDRDVLRKPIEERTAEETARVAKSKFLWGSYSPHAYWDCGVDARLPPSVAAHTYQPLRPPVRVPGLLSPTSAMRRHKCNVWLGVYYGYLYHARDYGPSIRPIAAAAAVRGPVGERSLGLQSLGEYTMRAFWEGGGKSIPVGTHG